MDESMTGGGTYPTGLVAESKAASAVGAAADSEFSAGFAASASTAGSVAILVRGDGPTTSAFIAASSLAGLSEMGVGIDGGAGCGVATRTAGGLGAVGGGVCGISRDVLRRRDLVSASGSDDGVAGRPSVRMVDERRTAAPILEAHFEAGLGVPGGVGLLIGRLSAGRKGGGVQIDR